MGKGVRKKYVFAPRRRCLGGETFAPPEGIVARQGFMEAIQSVRI